MANVTASQRRQHATVRVGGKAKYPIFSRATAESALRLIDHAKPPLTPSQKSAVRRQAARYVGKERAAEHRATTG